MSWLKDFSRIIGNFININDMYVLLILRTILMFLILYIIKKISIKIISLKKDNKKQYLYTKKFNLILWIVMIFIILFIWDEYIKSLITLISFVSAAITIALRELIFNFFCGIYISIKKIFSVEDRIEFDGIKGDVVNISSLSFELLEVDEEKKNGQSTGKIISVPNSIVFTKPVKNYNKAFKYIWNEINVKVPLDCDLKLIKQELYKIINNIEIVKKIPKKMQNQIKSVGTDYRIYFNKYEPMIYTKVIDDYIELEIRYLVHPKKARYVESIFWNEILIKKDEGLIKLYSKK